MSTNGYYHTLTDAELILHVDSNPCTELEYELADRLDTMRLDVEQLQADLKQAQQERDYERTI